MKAVKIKKLEPVAKLHISEKSMILAPVERPVNAWPIRIDGGLSKRAGEEMRSQQGPKGRFCTLWSFAIGSLVICLGIFSSPLFSENHVFLDSRPLDQEIKQTMMENRLAEIEGLQEVKTANRLPLPPLVPPMPRGEEAVKISSANPIIPIKTQRLAFLTSDQIMRTGATSYSPNIYHWIDSVPYDNVIKLEDGSEWTFNQADAFKVRTWRRGDFLILSPKMHWFWGADYSYTLINKTLNASVDVNLSQGPIEYGTYSTWIASIDYNNGQVFLMNGQGEKTTWVVSNADYYLLKDWKINDHVIVGENDHWIWWFSPFDHVLINVNMNHNVRVKHL